MSADYKVAEFEALREEIMFFWQQVGQIQTYAAAVTALIYSWLLTQKDTDSPLYAIAWALPAMFTALGAERTRVLFRRMSALGAYIRKLEESCYPKSDISLASLGWERSKGRLQSRRATILGTEKAFWIALFALNVGVPIAVLYVKNA